MSEDGFGALRNKRLRYVESARENDFEEGLRSLLAELYPDNAHFIYELLQNAEDAGATFVEFELGHDSLAVTHDGARAFSLADIESITGIGKSTKRDDETQIGKFGVGFKAVFAYTARPEIRSGEFSFAIADLFVPELIGGTARAGRTNFRFPFDQDEKPADVACAEVERGLRDLDEKTLLFLNNIREITYALPGGDVGFVKREDVDHLTIRVEASQGEEFVDSIWLRLVGPASTSQSHDSPISVAAAFKLEPKAANRGRSAASSDGSAEVSLGIVPLSEGDVSIYFPAVKETSHLKFHIHAPFASTVARDSVRDTAENTQLVADIGSLIVSNLLGFRERGLIDEGFLATLPNADDNLSPIYGQIWSAIVEAFNIDPLTPVRGGVSHKPARSLVSSPSEFRTGLEVADLTYLFEFAGAKLEHDPRWVRDFNGRAGQFVGDLDTLTFGWFELSNAFSRLVILDNEPEDNAESVSRPWHAWLEAKDDQKLLAFYELLGLGNQFELHASLGRIPIVRIRGEMGSAHVKGPETYLPATKSDTLNSRIPVELAYFDDDEPTKQSNSLRSFYSAAGVRRWDERARVDLRLSAYRNGNRPVVEDGVVPRKHLNDINAFVQFGHADPANARVMFRNIHFVLVEGKSGDLLWAKPGDLYLDEPFRTTGLSALYAGDVNRYALPGFYLGVEGIDDFLASLGSASGIEIRSTSVFQNTELRREWWANNRHSVYKQANDWRIEHLNDIVATADPILMEVLWNTVAAAKGTKALALYQANRSANRHVFNSQLYHQLTTTAWVLDRDGELRLPRAMTLEEIREGWSEPARDSLVHKLGFGAEAAQQEARAAAKPHYAEQLGIALDDAELIKEARAVGIDVEAAMQALIDLKQREDAFPEGASVDPDRRAATAALDASNAATHHTEIRSRSVVVGQGPSSDNARAYLREHYTNHSGDMYCQACHSILPFKVKGEWYFEVSQFVGNRNRNHRQNNLALCPLCAATYKYKRETSDQALLECLSTTTVEVGQGTIELPVLLNGQVVRLRLTGKHAVDLRSSMAVAGEARGQD